MIYILNDLCKSSIGYQIFGFLGILLNIIKICIPIILIVVGTIELVKCIISKSEEMNKSIKKLGIKAILGLVIFFVPSIVMFLMSLISNDFTKNECITCLLDTPYECMENSYNKKKTVLCSNYDNDEENCTSPCKYTSNGLCQSSR